MAKRIKLAAALNRTMEGRDAPGSRVDDDNGAEISLMRVGAVCDTAEDGTAAPSSLLAPLGRVVSGAAYGLGYYSSYGVVFSAMMLWHLLPLNSALGRGLRDGSEAGIKRYAKRSHRDPTIRRQPERKGRRDAFAV